MPDAISNITLGEALGWISGAAGVLALFVEITPKIKVNPISALLGWVGKRINAPMINQLKEQGKTVDGLAKTVDENEIDRIRWEILDFANSCRNRRRHTKDEFDHIIQLNDKYHAILKRRGMTNGQIDLEFEYIKAIYKHCQETNDFL